MQLHHKQVADANQPLTAPGAFGQAISEKQVCAVYYFMYRHVGNQEEAEDLTERAFSLANRASLSIQAEPRCASGTPPGMSIENRLCQTARSVVEEYFRAVYHSAQSLASDDTLDWPGVAATRSADHGSSCSDRVGRILAQLPAQDREFLTYRFLHNSSLAETASRMGITLARALALQWSALNNAAQIGANEKAIPSTPQK